MLPNNQSITTDTKHGDEYPQLNLKVFIVGSCFLSGAISMFAKAGCKSAKSVAEADLICYLGGEDVDPDLYGEKPLTSTYFNRARDDREIKIFEEALALEKPQFGICRGMQLLHVMNGGKLWQHVSRHAGSNHLIQDIQTGETYEASSMHHQMCIEDDNTFPLAYSYDHVAGTYMARNRELASDKHEDLEAAVWPNINAIGVQGHPEVSGTPTYTAWCLTKVEEFMSELQSMGSNSKPGASYVNPDRIDPSAVPSRILN